VWRITYIVLIAFIHLFTERRILIVVFRILRCLDHAVIVVSAAKHWGTVCAPPVISILLRRAVIAISAKHVVLVRYVLIVMNCRSAMSAVTVMIIAPVPPGLRIQYMARPYQHSEKTNVNYLIVRGFVV
jgi:hypothetical protein